MPTGPVIKPERYGAVGNGQSDDTAAVQRAVDVAAARSGSVLLADGATYLMTRSLLLPSGTHLTGHGATSVLRFTWLANDDDHDGFYVGNRNQTTGDTDITMADFAVRGPASGLPSGPNTAETIPHVPGIRLRQVDRFVVARVNISYVSGISLIHQGCSNGRIVRNRIHHSGRDGINSTWHIRNMHDIVIRGNRIRRIGDDGIAIIGAPRNEPNVEQLPYGIVVRNNRIVGWKANPNGLAMGRGISVIAATDVRIAGNLIERTHSHGILVIPSQVEASYDPATGRPWRSSDIGIFRNKILNAGALAVGSGPGIDPSAGHGVTVKSADRVLMGGNKIRNPAGRRIYWSDCQGCLRGVV